MKRRICRIKSKVSKEKKKQNQKITAGNINSIARNSWILDDL